MNASTLSSNAWQGQGRRLHIQEVGTRDGLQNESVFVPTEDKIALVNALSGCGLSKIEVTAFVSPTAIPALRDAEVVMRHIDRHPGVVYSALVPNVRGAERAIESCVDELNLVMSASETHNLCNLRMTRSQSLAALAEVARVARAAKVAVNASISCSFGCPMAGDVDEAEVMGIAAKLIEKVGVNGITLCDTTGMAYPSQVFALTAAFRARWPSQALTLHFHNTRGMGLANVLAGVDAGADRLDTSLGGLGGCPYAPGASGNVCSEEVVQALNLMGYTTGVDLERLLQAARLLPGLLSHEVPSQLVKAGPRDTRHALPDGFESIRARAYGMSPAVL